MSVTSARAVSLGPARTSGCQPGPLWVSLVTSGPGCPFGCPL